MILDLDASALIKRYVAEAGSDAVAELIEGARVTATAVISRAEVTAALAKVVRVGPATRENAAKGVAAFDADWDDLIRLEVNEPIVARAATLTSSQGLRGYDAVHLACALMWQESLGDTVMLATLRPRAVARRSNEWLAALASDRPMTSSVHQITTHNHEATAR